MLIYSQ